VLGDFVGSRHWRREFSGDGGGEQVLRCCRVALTYIVLNNASTL
jgi:hypothetical protein